MNRMLAGLVGATLIASADAETFNWKSGSTDWSSPDSYKEAKAPAEGDTVVIPDNVTAAASDADTGSWDTFSKLAKVLYGGKYSRLEITVGETDGVPNVREVACEVHINSASPTSGQRNSSGKVVKRGPGVVRFTKNTTVYVLWTPIEVFEGTLAMPNDYPASPKISPSVGPVTVHEGAVFMPSRPEAGANIQLGVTTTSAIWGGGVISNTCGQRLIVNGSDWCCFSGRVYNVRWNASGYVKLTGTNNVIVNGMTLTGGTTGLRKFGKLAASDNSIGKSQELYHNGSSRFLYLGETADETDRPITLYGCEDGPAVFDAGEHGEITLSGSLVTSSRDPGFRTPKTYVFQGSNAVESVFSGAIADTFYAGTDMRLTLAKRGPGTWRFADNAKRTWGGDFRFEDGTLACTSLAEAGKVCSLGTATNLPNAYAWTFGAARTRGTLEYVGDADATLTSRASVVTGQGGTLANSGGGALRYFAGVRPLGTETNAFGVGGSSTAGNAVRNLSDGDGQLSLVKEGPGSWTLEGLNDFSGALVVKEGTLYVRDQTRYSWVRLTLKGSQNPEGTDTNIKTRELGLWDGTGRRINAFLDYSANYYTASKASLPIRAFGYDCSGTPRTYLSGNTYAVTNLFDDTISLSILTMNKSNGDGRKLIYGDESTYLKLVMHLGFGDCGPAQFDVVFGEKTAARQFKQFSIEGSLDGVNWVDIAKDSPGDQVISETWSSSKWVYRNTEPSYGSLATHVNGLALLTGPANATPSLDKVQSVSVAKDARLVCENKSIVIKGLAVAAVGAGTIVNATIAATGKLEIPDLSGRVSVLPISFEDCAGVENIGDWTVTCGGKDKPGYGLSIGADGKIHVTPPGVMILVR